MKDKNLVVRIPHDLHKKYKVKAANSGKTLRELIIEALRKYE